MRRCSRPPSSLPLPSRFPAVPGLQNFGRVDHYFQSPSQNSEQQHGSEFLKQLFQYPHSSCIAVQGGGTEGYVVNRAFITEAQQTQAKLIEMVQSLQRENEKLKNAAFNSLIEAQTAKIQTCSNLNIRFKSAKKRNLKIG